jgi:hypothetical protein
VCSGYHCFVNVHPLILEMFCQYEVVTQVPWNVKYGNLWWRTPNTVKKKGSHLYLHENYSATKPAGSNIFLSLYPACLYFSLSELTRSITTQVKTGWSRFHLRWQLTRLSLHYLTRAAKCAAAFTTCSVITWVADLAYWTSWWVTYCLTDWLVICEWRRGRLTDCWVV